jgi:hypothetical protein
MKKFTCEIYAENFNHVINELHNIADDIETGTKHNNVSLPVMNFESNWMMTDIKKKGKQKRDEFGW